MRSLAALLFPLFLLAGPMAPAAPAAAQSPIHRCVSAQGNPVFTDRSCADLRATPVTGNSAAPSSPGQGVPLQPPPILCARDNQQLRQSVIDAFANHDANRLAGLMLWSGYSHRAAVANIESLRATMRQPILDVDGPGDDATPFDDPTPLDDPTPSDGPTPSDTTPSAALGGMPMDPFPPASSNPPPVQQLVVHTAGTDGSGIPHALRFDIIPRDGCLWLGNAG